MSISFVPALNAASCAASDQDYPKPALYVVATPIGNLADISLRALHVLQLVDQIACEDTRHSQRLLQTYGIRKPLLCVHQHNETQSAQTVLAHLRAGERVAFVSDAGTPAISDPGSRLVRDVHAAGFRVLPLPGASSVTAALSVAGLDASDSAAFVFVGFFPTKARERVQCVEKIALDPRAAVALETPHRIVESAAALALLGQRLITVCRELTKQFEQIYRCEAQHLSAWLQTDPQNRRGEFVLVIHPTTVSPDSAHEQGLRVLRLLLPELPLKTAVQLAAQISGAARSPLYAAALELAHLNGAGLPEK